VLDLSLNQSNANSHSKASLRSNDINSARTILAVDDEYDIVNLIKLSLEIDGQRVCIFTDPLTALAHFNNSDPKDYHHIVISDIRMPGMNGYEFVNHVKKIDPKVKVILMSAFELNDSESSNLAIDAFIKKPFSLITLNNVVKQQYKQIVNLM
jgi:DNA-binding NtrC family response regulator